MPDHPFTPDLFERDGGTEFPSPADLGGDAEEMLATLLGELVSPGVRILEVGPGRESPMLRHLEAVEIVGMGSDADILAANRDLDRAEVVDLDGADGLPFADDFFGAVLVARVLPFLTRPVDLFQGLVRVVSPGSWIVLALPREAAGAVRVWRKCRSDAERMQLGMAYLTFAGGWVDVRGISPDSRREGGVLTVVGRRPVPSRRPSVRSAGWSPRRG